MFRSIFSKYIAIFMLIIVLSFVTLGIIISSMMSDYYTRNAENQLKTTASSMQSLIIQRLNDKNTDNVAEFLSENHDEVNAVFSALIRISGNDFSAFVTDGDGLILISIGFTAPDFSGREVSPEIMQSVGSGFYTSKGDMLGLMNAKRLVYGLPIEKGGEKIGTVFVCTTSESVNSLVHTTVRAVIMSCLWMMLAALIVVYFVTDREISPLKEMSKAAKSFARGKFDVRVPVYGRDEIAELGLAMNNMASSLENLEKSRSEFLSNVSHDLRTPMTTISGFIDALLDDTIPRDKWDYYLRLIGDEVRRLSRLVGALLDVTRLQSGDRKFVMTTFDICEIARVILLSFEQKIEKKKLDVEFDVEKENIFVSADRDAIHQVLYNICDNAVKFSREGGKYRIRIKSKGKKVYVSVYNEGQGMKEEDIPHVFDRFFKGDRSRGMDKTGTGLGMYIAKAIIDAHGEEIWVSSVYGENCEFVFTLTEASAPQQKMLTEGNS